MAVEFGEIASGPDHGRWPAGGGRSPCRGRREGIYRCVPACVRFPGSADAIQLALFAPGPSEVERELRELRELDLDRMTPIDALLKLKELREKA